MTRPSIDTEELGFLGWSVEERQRLEQHLMPFPNGRKAHIRILRSCKKKSRQIGGNEMPWTFSVRWFRDGKVPPGDKRNEEEIRDLVFHNSGITERMKAQRWCPSTIQLLRDAFHVPGLHIAELMGPPKLYEKEKRDHGNCTASQCNALQVPEDALYAAEHIAGCRGDCATMSVDIERVRDIIEAGQIPVVSMPPEDSAASDTQLEVLPAAHNTTDAVKFVSISHVYAHKIGNGNNTMPKCQFQRLQRYLRQLSRQPLAIWMDVFCIPTAKEYVQVRRLAISRIKDAFKYASHMLVLDTTLLDTVRDSNVQLTIRIIGSDWMRRVWTLEEVMLACSGTGGDRELTKSKSRKVVFQLDGGQITLGKLLDNLQGTKNCPYARTAKLALEKHLISPVAPDRLPAPSRWPQLGDFSALDSRASQLARLAKPLEYRNTSRAGDEILCMGSILELPAEAMMTILQSTDQAAMMRAFYLSVHRLPLSLLFCNGERMAEAPFRWAMRSFLTTVPHDNAAKADALEGMAAAKIGECRADGLHVNAEVTVFRLGKSNYLDFNRVWIRPTHDADDFILEPTNWDTNAHLPPERPHWHRMYAIEPEEDLALMVNPASNSEGLVLKVLEQEDGAYRAEFLCQVYIGKNSKREFGFSRYRHPSSSGWMATGGRSWRLRTVDESVAMQRTRSTASSVAVASPISTAFASPVLRVATLKSEAMSRDSSRSSHSAQWRAPARTTTADSGDSSQRGGARVETARASVNGSRASSQSRIQSLPKSETDSRATSRSRRTSQTASNSQSNRRILWASNVRKVARQEWVLQ